MTTYTAFIQPRAVMAQQIVDGIGRFAANLAALRRYHQTVNALSRLDDCELEDIGLCRADIRETARATAYWA